MRKRTFARTYHEFAMATLDRYIGGLRSISPRVVISCENCGREVRGHAWCGRCGFENDRRFERALRGLVRASPFDEASPGLRFLLEDGPKRPLMEELNETVSWWKPNG